MFYVDNSGNQFESYEAACIYYGADTPAQLAAEAAADYAAELEEWLDHCAEFDLFVPWDLNSFAGNTDCPF